MASLTNGWKLFSAAALTALREKGFLADFLSYEQEEVEK